MLAVEIWLNDTLISEAKAVNISDLAPNSDYVVDVAGKNMNGVHSATSFRIDGHSRNAGAWELVRRIAEQMVAEAAQS